MPRADDDRDLEAEPLDLLELVEVGPGADRDAYLPLFRLADDSEPEIRGYRDAGTLYGLVVSATREPIGHTLVVPGGEPGTAELKSVAIAEHRQGRGLGAAMLERVLVRLAAGGARRVIVGTASAGVGNLVFYQKAGFRLFAVERDYFSPQKGYAECVEDGIPIRDMVWMDRWL